MSKDVINTEFKEGVDFEFIQSLPNNGTKYLLIFDDSCEEISSSKDFVKIPTAGGHKGLSTIYSKHNFFHQSRLGSHIELQNTHIVLFKSHRDVLQKNTLSQQLRLGSQLKDWYTKATSIPYGHLLIDLSPKTLNSLRFCTNSRPIHSIFFLPQHKQQTTFVNDEQTTLYSDNVPKLFPEFQKKFPKNLSKRIFSVPKRVHRKPA